MLTLMLGLEVNIQQNKLTAKKCKEGQICFVVTF